MNVVCVAAHQDDIELHCLGTLIKYREQGDVTITNVVITNGDKGGQFDPSLSYEEVAAIRHEEATAVAEALGGRYVCLGETDEYLRNTDETLNHLLDVLREAKADIVFAPPPVDYNTDHTIASQMAFQATMLAGVRTIFTAHEPLAAYPPVYYMDPVTGLDWQPTHYVDITAVFERKCALLRLHKSQMLNMQTSGGWDLVEYARIVGAFRGLQCGVEYAEAFKPALAWPRVRPGNWLP
ncbi:MAG: PIG-L family deacetylase [Anaerolineae bacterium]|nr:PIG-L family deacetylase [Anaerolineae bacterium]